MHFFIFIFFCRELSSKQLALISHFFKQSFFSPYDSFKLSQHASSAVSVCGSAAVLRCVSSLLTSTLQGQISGGCNSLTSNQNSSSKYSGLWGSNWDKCIQLGRFTPNNLRCSSEGGAKKIILPDFEYILSSKSEKNQVYCLQFLHLPLSFLEK